MDNLNNDSAVESNVEEVVVEETKTEEASSTPVVEEVKSEDVAIKSPVYPGNEEVQALGSVANGAIGATTAQRPKAPSAKKAPEAKKETVAIRSTRNVSWVGVGKVSKGINIVSKDEADKWLTRDHITKVSPDDVAKEYGK
jgi:hypothetical protein